MSRGKRRNRSSAERSAARRRRLEREAIEARTGSRVAYSTKTTPDTTKGSGPKT